VSSETIFQGALLHVRKDRVLLPNGKESIREYIVHPGAVVILAFLRQRQAAVRAPVPLSACAVSSWSCQPARSTTGEAIIETAARIAGRNRLYVAASGNT
jgi:ADP-ribose pyrophosphatase